MYMSENEYKVKRLRYAFGAFVISAVTGLQLYAWTCGYDGHVFATTSAIIGAVGAGLLGFEIGKKSE